MSTRRANIENELYDYIVCGGGISGLYITYKLLKFDTNYKILLLYDGVIGGKVASKTLGVGNMNTQNIESHCIETGASKFTRKDSILMDLLTSVGLNTMISPADTLYSKNKVYIHFKEDKDKDGYIGLHPKVVVDFDVNAEFRNIFRTIDQMRISPEDQLKSTLYELLKHRIYPFIYTSHASRYSELSRYHRREIRMRLVKLIHSHGMDSDFMILNGWIAIQRLRELYIGESMIRNNRVDNYGQFITISPHLGGMSQITAELVRRIEFTNRVTIRKLHVTSINLQEKRVIAREVSSRSHHVPYNFTCAREVICAIPSDNLRNIALKRQYFDKKGRMVRLSIFDTVISQPLIKIYAKIDFNNASVVHLMTPPNRSSLSRINITDSAPIVTVTVNNPIKMLIPYDYENQIYLIYCDAYCARTWGKIYKDQGEDNILPSVEQYIKEIGFKCTVKWTSIHYWPSGLYCWKTGTDPIRANKHTIEKLNIVGSSFALNQSTIEGALSTCNEWLKIQGVVKN